jgi:FkbM family methyltransferase
LSEKQGSPNGKMYLRYPNEEQLKRLLYFLLSERQYLMTLHRSFYFMYRLGLLKNKQSFKFHYFIQRIIQPEYVVIDIGANLGYFAKTFSRLVPNGKLIAIEPLPQFHAVLDLFIGSKENVELHNVALGKTSGSITMVLPKTNGMMRTGLPHVMRNEQEGEHQTTQQVQMVNTSAFFSTFERIDYIKCDIEGHEWEVISQLGAVLKEKRPIVQIEIDPKNTELLINFFSELGFVQHGIVNGKCVAESGKQSEQGDYLFIPSEKINLVDQWNA